ncbi:MAG: glycosyltransferase family 4 protein [Gaiellaceae bacterium]
MRVAFDVSPLSHRRSGVGNYILGSLRGFLEAACGRHEVVAFAPTSPAGKRAIPEALAGLDVDLRLVTLPVAHAWRTAWSRLGRPAAERFLGAFDVLHFTDWMYPPQRAGLRSTMVHDLVPVRFPEWAQSRTRSMHGAKYRHMAERCDVILTNSRYTADDVVEYYGVPRERLHVAYPGADGFSPDGERRELGRPFALTVATLEPRKNLGTLVDAYRLLDSELALAVVGGAGWGAQPQLDVAGVERLDYVPNEQLPELYRAASVFVYPSRFEGFGMPVIEAMASGVPVVCSSHPSMDEACGDAAVRADPDDPAALAVAIERALAERDRLVPLGLDHARRFTWRATGEAMLEAWSR